MRQAPKIPTNVLVVNGNGRELIHEYELEKLICKHLFYRAYVKPM